MIYAIIYRKKFQIYSGR